MSENLATSLSPQLVIGLGTGRCGTDSLAYFLDLQEGANVSHEMFKHKLTWQGAEKQIDKLLQWMKLQTDQRLVGDVAFAYLPYVGYILSRWPTAKFICLQRDRTETVESFIKKTPGRNHWVQHDGTQWQADRWDACFPHYAAMSKPEAIGYYWDEYYATAAELQATYPAAFRIFPTTALNQLEGQQALLYFIGIPHQQLGVPAHVHENQSPSIALSSQAQPTSIHAPSASIAPVVSVLMTVYNGAHFIEQTIVSVLNQSFTNFEFVVIDDGSTDATPQILATYAALDERIILLHQPEKGGEAAAYNRALSIARGRYLVIAVEGFFSLPQRFQCQVEFLDQHPEIGVLGTQLAYRTALNRLTNVGKPVATTLLHWHLLFSPQLTYATVMLRRELLQQVSGWPFAKPEALMYDLSIRLSRLTQLANLPTQLVYCQCDDPQATVGQPEQQAVIDQMAQVAQGDLLDKVPCLDDVIALRRAILTCEQLASSGQVWRVMRLLSRLYAAYLRTASLRATEKRQLTQEVAGHFVVLSLNHRRKAPIATIYGLYQWVSLRRRLPTIRRLIWVMHRIIAKNERYTKLQDMA